jgi:hypothetical protein
MTETELTYLVIGSIALALISAMRAAHWKAKYETLDVERSVSGWEGECKFWRRHFNRDAAEAVEDGGF